MLQRGGALAALLACGLLGEREAAAATAGSGFEATSLHDALIALGSEPVGSDDIVLDIADVAENGAFVPVSIESKLPDTREIAILADGNPFPLVALFAIAPGTDPFVSARVRLAGDCRVLAVVRSEGRLYSASRTTRVTVSGCG